MADPANGRPQVGKVRSKEEHAALLTYHIAQIRTQRAAVERANGPVEEAKAELKEERDELSSRFDQAQIDLGRLYTRKYLEGLITDGDAKIRTLVEYEKMRATDKLALSQPVYGQQPELFPGDETPTAARDEMAWEAEGYHRGLRGDLEEIQQGDPPAFHQAIMRGYEEGQAKTRDRVAEAMALKQREGEPDAGQEAVDLNGGDDALDPDVIADKADELKRSAFMDRTAPEEEFEASDDELAQQSTRKAVVEGREGGDAANDQAAA